MLKFKNQEIITPVLIFFITRIAICLAVYTGLVLFCFQMKAAFVPGPFADNLFLAPWTRWDTGHYANLIENGYREFALAAFFPLYPLLSKILDLFIHNSFLSAVLLANLSFLLALIFLYKLVLLKFKDPELAERTVLYISIFPTTFFFISGLTESTFLLMSVLAFYFAEKEKWWWSGLFGILTSLTRSAGFLIALPMVLMYLSKKKLKFDFLGTLIIPLGLLVFMGILMLYGRNPLDFVYAGQAAWPRIFALPTWDIYRSIQELSGYESIAILAGNYPVKLLAGVILVLAFSILAVICYFKTDINYGIYSILLILFALCNPARDWPLYGDLRFILVMFPIFILLAQYGKNKIAHNLIVVFSLLFLAIFAVFNGMGGWIS